MAHRKRYAVRYPGERGMNGAGSRLHTEHRTVKAARVSAQALANKLGRPVDIEWDRGDPDRPKQSAARGKKAPRRTYKTPATGIHGPHGPHSAPHFVR